MPHLPTALLVTAVLLSGSVSCCNEDKLFSQLTKAEEDHCMNLESEAPNGPSSTCGQTSPKLSGSDQAQLGMDDTCATMAAMSTSLALVPYDEDKVLPHEKTVREFSLAGHRFIVRQDWQKLGVAAVVWDSAVVLAEYLIKNQALVEGKNVLELGAGTGLTGMVSASLGARVTVTEREEAMSHLKMTINDNAADKSWELSSEKLDWRDDIKGSMFADLDVIIGADIIYIEETFQDLLRTILSLARASKTLVLLSCKIRYDRDLHFLDLLREQFDVDEVLYDREKDIKIFSCHRHS